MLSTPDGTCLLLLPCEADACVRLTVGPTGGRVLIAQTNSLAASTALPKLDVAVRNVVVLDVVTLGTHKRIAASAAQPPAPEPTWEPEPKAKTLEVLLPSPPLTPRHRRAALPAADKPHAHMHFSASADGGGAGNASMPLADASVYFTVLTSLANSAALDTPACAAFRAQQPWPRSTRPRSERPSGTRTRRAPRPAHACQRPAHRCPARCCQLVAACGAGRALDAAQVHLHCLHRLVHAVADPPRAALVCALAAPVPAKPRRAAGTLCTQACAHSRVAWAQVRTAWCVLPCVRTAAQSCCCPCV
jgi:hypothetical protein